MRIAEFDYRKSEQEAAERLSESPPIACIWHLQGDEWVEIYPLPPQAVATLKYVFVLADRDAACDDAHSGQLKHEIGGALARFFETGHSAGERFDRQYIKALRDGREAPEMRFADGDQILDWILADLTGETEELQDNLNLRGQS